MHGNCLTNQRPGNNRNSVEHDQMLIKPEEAHELALQIWAQSNQQYVRKCAELLDQSEAKKQQKISGAWPKVNQAWEAHKIWSQSEKRFVRKSTQTSQQIRGQEKAEIQRSVTKLIKPGEAHNELAHLIWAQSDQQFVCKCVETAWPIRGQETAPNRWNVSNSQSGLRRPILWHNDWFWFDSFIIYQSRGYPEKQCLSSWDPLHGLTWDYYTYSSLRFNRYSNDRYTSSHTCIQPN